MPWAPTSRTSPRGSVSTDASAANSCMPGRASAARAFQRTAARWCARRARRRRAMADRIIAACGGSVAGKRLAVLGLTFKPNTDDMRDAPSLVILPALLTAGAEIRAFDPEGMEEAKKLLPGLSYCADPYEAMAAADALILLTEWNAFRALDLERAKNLLRTPLVIDLRNIYEPQQMIAAGLAYVSIGRPAYGPTRRALRALA